MHKGWFIPLLLAILAFAASFSGEQAARAWRYERADIIDGEIWRLLSGNLVHADANHWLFNMLTLGLLWLLYEKYISPLWGVFILTATAMGTTLGLLLFNPQLQWYVGLSGALHGFIVAGALITLRNEPKLQSALLVLVLVKLVIEQLSGPLGGTQQWISVKVAVDSHLYGALTGLFFGLVYISRGLWQRKAS